MLDELVDFSGRENGDGPSTSQPRWRRPRKSASNTCCAKACANTAVIGDSVPTSAVALRATKHADIDGTRPAFPRVATQR